MNPLYPALKRLPFSGFQSLLIADRRASAIRPAIETLQKANRSCGRGAATPRRNEPFIFRLEPVTFFRVSKLTHRRPKEAVQFGPRSKPCKRQTAPAAGGTDGNRSRQGIFL